MRQLDLIARLQSILPDVRDWIEKTLHENRDHSVPVVDFASPRLARVFPRDLLERTKTVVVCGKVPFPPLGSMGIPEFAYMENMTMAGITCQDTYFVNHRYQLDRLHFHELVHVVQWDILGADRFLLAYGAGLVQSGYEGCPLEKMAFDLEANYDSGRLPVDIIEFIRQETDRIWDGVFHLFPNV